MPIGTAQCSRRLGRAPVGGERLCVTPPDRARVHAVESCVRGAPEFVSRVLCVGEGLAQAPVRQQGRAEFGLALDAHAAVRHVEFRTGSESARGRARPFAEQFEPAPQQGDVGAVPCKPRLLEQPRELFQQRPGGRDAPQRKLDRQQVEMVDEQLLVVRSAPGDCIGLAQPARRARRYRPRIS